LSSAFLQCEELVAQIDKGRSAAFAAKFEHEQSTIKSESLLNITDFQCYVIEPTARASFASAITLF
jgi:hypothetical protein